MSNVVLSAVLLAKNSRVLGCDVISFDGWISTFAVSYYLHISWIA